MNWHLVEELHSLSFRAAEGDEESAFSSGFCKLRLSHASRNDKPGALFQQTVSGAIGEKSD